jgi:hypothetical protein
MKDTLTTILATSAVPADLAITYDDMHGLWGGTTISVCGDGSVERHTKALGAVAAQVSHTTIDQHMLLDLVRLLVQLDAWEQRIPDRPPVPDESRASLTISVNGSTNRIWERFNDLPANNRLVQIKTWLGQA